MNWEPLSETEVWDEINSSYERMSLEEKNLWEAIKIIPEKWQEISYGKEGGGFWVVALIGSTVVWYNDIEEGFNRSKYHQYGIIDEYWCNQDNLEWAVQHIINEIKEGYPSGGKAGPPEPIA